MSRKESEFNEAAVDGARTAIEGLNVIVAHDREDTLRQLISIVERRHTVLCHCESVTGMLETAAEQRPDMIITGVSFPDGDGIETVIRIGAERPVPSVIVAERGSLDMVEKAMADHVMAYLVMPVDPADLEAAMVVAQARFDQFQEVVSEVDSLRQALADRKVIERAKGAIMADRKIEEDAAFAMLRTRAQNARMKLIDVANGVLEHGPGFVPERTGSIGGALGRPDTDSA